VELQSPPLVEGKIVLITKKPFPDALRETRGIERAPQNPKDDALNFLSIKEVDFANGRQPGSMWLNFP